MLPTRMDGELRVEISGYRITVSKAPSPATASPADRLPTVDSCSSSFELVDFSSESGAYSSAASPGPYPLQASGPSIALDLGSPSAKAASPPRHQVRSLVSSPSRPFFRMVPHSSAGPAGQPVSRRVWCSRACFPSFLAARRAALGDHRVVVSERDRDDLCEARGTANSKEGPDTTPAVAAEGSPGRRGVEQKATARRSLGGKARGSCKGEVEGIPGDSSPSAVHAPHPVEDSPLLPGREFSFCLWASSLVRLVLKSGTSFSHFLSSTLPLCRDGSLPVASALFPLPLPAQGVFARRSRRRTQRRRLPHLVSVVLHVLVMGLNFVYADGKHIPPDCLRRPPSEVQVSAFSRLRGLVRACARLGGTSLQPGRRGLQLAARHAEVVSFLRDHGFPDLGCYGGCAEARLGQVVPEIPGGPPGLDPYRDLDASYCDCWCRPMGFVSVPKP